MPTAIVTGASSGIGEATASTLAERGFRVWAVARRVDKMAHLAGGGIEVAELDVTDDDSMRTLIERIVAEDGRIDVLVNNAGYGSYGSIEEVPIDEARRQIEVNVFGLARMCQLVIPHMRERGRGRIVNISSIGGRFSEPLGGWYHASKYAVEALSDSLRMELAPFGIKVVIIEPGAIATEWGGIAVDSLQSTSGDGPYAAQARGLAAMHAGTYRMAGTPQDVADAILTAATRKHPRARYAAPPIYGAALGVLHLLPSAAKDALVLRATGGGSV